MTNLRAILNRITIVVNCITLLLVGCGVPELEEPAAAPQVSSAPVAQPAAPVGSPTPAAPAAAPSLTPQQAASEEPPNTNSASGATGESIKDRRGLMMEDWPDGFVYVLARSSAAKTAEAIAKLLNYQAKEAKLGDPADPRKPGTIVSQFAGHDWSQFAWFDDEPESAVKELSGQLATEVIMIAYSDFSGWQFIDVYNRGEPAEAFHWGLDYSEDIGGGPDLAEWETHTKVTTNYEGVDMTDQFLFRSKLRKVNEADIAKGEEFASWLLGQHEAYFSDVEMAWFGEEGNIESSLAPSAFDSIRIVAGP